MCVRQRKYDLCHGQFIPERRSLRSRPINNDDDVFRSINIFLSSSVSRLPTRNLGPIIAHQYAYGISMLIGYSTAPTEPENPTGDANNIINFGRNFISTLELCIVGMRGVRDSRIVQ